MSGGITMKTARVDASLPYIKALAFAAWILVMVFAGLAFREHRAYKEPVVTGPGVSSVKTLGDWYAPMKGSINDCNVYILDSGIPGGTVLVLGATHAEEPATNLAAALLVENAKPAAGRLIVAIHTNRSASTVTRPGDAYPSFYTIPTAWGQKKFRMGDRYANPLDSWPDPETFVHYPSGQLLAYMDTRNTNRTWPGKADGSLCERTTYAFMRLIEAEKVDIAIDLHEAELEYPVIGTIVAHQELQEIAAMASMDLSASQFRIGMEVSPKTLHGLSHREIGDHSDAAGLLFESPEPFLDRVRGVTDEKLLLTGQDDFVMKAGKAGLLYWPIDEKGWPIETRVGRHVVTIAKVLEVWSLLYPEKTVAVEGLPSYEDFLSRGVGAFFHDPKAANPERIALE
jgi:hypothetical protein